MTKDAWLKKARKARDSYDIEKKGGKPLTDAELKTLGEIKVAFGSVHGRHSVTYRQAHTSLVEMITIVEGGSKDDKFD